MQDAAAAELTPFVPLPASAAKAELKKAIPTEDSISDDESPSEDGGLDTANQFSTLVEASAVEFSSSREVEQLSRGSVKIRLSRGQVCHSASP